MKPNDTKVIELGACRFCRSSGAADVENDKIRCNDKYINPPSAAALDKNVIGKGDTKKPDTDFYKHDKAKSYQPTDVG